MTEFVSRPMPSNGGWSRAAYGAGRFVAISTAPTNNKVAHSDTGLTWEEYASPAPSVSSSANNSLVFQGGLFLANFSSTGSIWRSADGLSWSSATVPGGESTNWILGDFGAGKHVAISSVTAVCAYSPDGATWVQATVPLARQWRAPAFGNSTFVTVGPLTNGSDSTSAMTSLDGVTWTSRTLPATRYWSSVTFGPAGFVACAWGTTNIAVSADGISWTLSTIAVAGTLSIISGANGYYFARTSSALYMSADAVSWEVVVTPTLIANGAVYGNGVYVATLSGATVLTSGDPIPTPRFWTILVDAQETP